MSVITYYSSLALSQLLASNSDKNNNNNARDSQNRDTNKSKRGSIKK